MTKNKLSTRQALHRSADFMKEYDVTAHLFAIADESGKVVTGITLCGLTGALGSILCTETGEQSDLSSEDVVRCETYAPTMLTRLMRPLRIAIRTMQDEGTVLLVDSRLGILPGIDD